MFFKQNSHFGTLETCIKVVNYSLWYKCSSSDSQVDFFVFHRGVGHIFYPIVSCQQWVMVTVITIREGSLLDRQRQFRICNICSRVVHIFILPRAAALQIHLIKASSQVRIAGVGSCARHSKRAALLFCLPRCLSTWFGSLEFHGWRRRQNLSVLSCFDQMTNCRYCFVFLG